MGHDQSHRNPRRCPTVLASPSLRLPSTFPAIMGWHAYEGPLNIHCIATTGVHRRSKSAGISYGRTR